LKKRSLRIVTAESLSG